MAVVSTGQITIIDVNDYTYQGTTAPKNPIPNVTIWIDTSVSPSVMKRWTGTVWEIVHEVKIGGRNYLRNSGNFKNLYFWSTYVSTSATLVGSVMRITAGASRLPRYINTTLIPLTDSPQDFIISVRYIGEIEVNIGGKSSTSLSSIVENSNTQSAGTFTKIRTDNFPNNEKISYFYWKTLVKGDALSSFVWINIPINTTIDLISIKVEKGNKATDWTPAPEDVETLITQEIQDVENKITGLETTVNTTFKDGIIEQAEAKAIEKYINSLNAEKSDIDNQYNTIYNDALLTGTAKDNLFSQKESYNTAHSQLIGSINTAIADGKTTPSEKSNVDSKFTNYKNVLGGLAIRLTEALKAIEAKRIDNVQIGGRNLLKKSMDIHSKSGYGWIIYELTEKIEGTYTIQFWIENTIENSAGIGFGTVGGYDGSYFDLPVLKDGVYTKTFTNLNSGNNTHLTLWVNNNTNIKKAKLEKGNKATDWTPAPEDQVSDWNTTDTNSFSFIKNKPTDDIAKGVQAYNWGNHASAGYALANGTNATGNWGINITGNAATATKLQTPRKINGVSFDGSEDITIKARTNLTAGTNIAISGNQISVVSSPTFSGNVTASGFYESSLRELKENILPFESSGLGLVSQLEIVTYDRIDKSSVNKIGIIADDSPEEFLSEDKDAVDLYKTVFIQAKAIQELKSEVDELKEELNNLRDLIMLNLNQF